MAKKIVIVDDDADIRDALQAILEGEDYTVVTAANKASGMETIRSEKPDLAVLDVMMDTYNDGFEMARELKSDDEMKNMPILMLTGVRKETGIDFKGAAGDDDWCPVDTFLEKPVDPDVFITEIGKLVS